MTSVLSRAVFSYLALSAGAAALAGCLGEPGDPGEPEEGSVSADVQIDNGKSLNGVSFNGTSLNGKSLNGQSLNGINLAGIQVTGATMTGVSVSATQLRGTRSGVAISGAAFVGATLSGVLADGTAFAMRIDSSAMLAAPNSDVREYAFSYNTTGGWQPLCTDPTFGNQAIVFPGTWNLGTARHQPDANMFTVGCRGANFAKCEELGYKGDSLIDTYLETCIRALRADYCGDGVSHTIDGTQINIYDKLGIQADTEAWSVESNWTPDGALCIGKGRIATTLTVPAVPQCMAQRATVPCVTTSWQPTALLRTEVNK